MRFVLPLAVAAALAACQPTAPPQSPDQAIVAQTTPAFTVDTCKRLGTYAIAIADGRRDGITRDEALLTAEAGPLTPLFETIVTGVYDARRPTNAAEWEELRRLYAVLTAQGCIRAATGEQVEVRTRG